MNQEISITLPEDLPQDLVEEIKSFAPNDLQATLKELTRAYRGIAGSELSATDSGIQLATSVRSAKTKRRIGVCVTACLGEDGRPVARFKLIECGHGHVLVAQSAIGNTPYQAFTDVMIHESSDGYLRGDVGQALGTLQAKKDMGKGRFVCCAEVPVVVKSLAAYGVECVLSETGLF